MKYSIIIPCYNAENTIKEAIESIPNQPSLIEIIVIDDGSKDKTYDLVCSLKDDYKNLVVIRQDNQGAGAARKTGVERAKGDYILFLDSDDVFDRTAFDVFETVTKEHPNADIIRFKNNNFVDINETYNNPVFNLSNNDPIVSLEIGEYLSIYNRDSFIHDIYCNEIVDGTVAVTLWGKIYKRDIFINSVKDYGKNILEDYYINMQYYTCVNTCIDIDIPLYWWRESNNGASHTYHPGTPDMIEIVHKYKLDCMKSFEIANDEQIRRANDWLMRFVAAVIYFMKDMKRKDRKNEFKKIHSILKKYAVYGNLGSSANLRDSKILKTRCYTIIDLYYQLRWRKS